MTYRHSRGDLCRQEFSILQTDLVIEGDVPSLTNLPNIGRSGIGTTTSVLPLSAKYTINNGIEAMIGIGSLCLHRMSKTSSRKPSKVAIKSESKDER